MSKVMEVLVRLSFGLLGALLVYAVLFVLAAVVYVLRQVMWADWFSTVVLLLAGIAFGACFAGSDVEIGREANR